MRDGSDTDPAANTMSEGEVKARRSGEMTERSVRFNVQRTLKEKEPKPQVSGGRQIPIGGTKKKPNDNKSLSLIFVPPEMTERSVRFNVQWTLKEKEPKPQVSGGRQIPAGGTKKSPTINR